jgi:hypothetical protein
MSRKPLLVLCLLFLVAAEGSGAHAGVLQDTARAGQSAQPNTWSAKSSTGLTVGGTWTVVADPTTATVSGTWTLVDARRKTVIRGGWSAAKSPAEWTGTWRAAASGSTAEYSGSWSAAVDLKADARFADLFEIAVQTVVSGNWRAGRQSGTWSIRAFR